MESHEKALQTLSVLIAGGDGNDLGPAEKAVDELVSSNVGHAQSTIRSLLVLDEEIRSLRVYQSRDSVDFASYVLRYIERQVRSLKEAR